MEAESKPDSIKRKVPRGYLRTQPMSRDFVWFLWMAVSMVLDGLLVRELLRYVPWWAAPLVFAAVLLAAHLIFSRLALAAPVRTTRVELTGTALIRDGWYINWSDVQSYQIADVRGLPDLRALEVTANWGRGSQAVTLVFDPAEVNEELLLAFLDEAAHGKRWQR
jgi:hypothetical protein